MYRPCPNFNQMTLAEHLAAARDHLAATLGEDPCPDAPNYGLAEAHNRRLDALVSTLKKQRASLEAIRSLLERQLNDLGVYRQLEREKREEVARQVLDHFSGINGGHNMHHLLHSQGYPNARVIITSNGCEVDFGDEEES